MGPVAYPQGILDTPGYSPSLCKWSSPQPLTPPHPHPTPKSLFCEGYHVQRLVDQLFIPLPDLDAALHDILILILQSSGTFEDLWGGAVVCH